MKCESNGGRRKEAHGLGWCYGGVMVFEDSKRGYANSKRKATRGATWVAIVLILR